MAVLYVVGIGPGRREMMTVEAAEVLERCPVIAGYTVYVDLVKEHFAGKEFLTTPMKKETQRCRMAFAEAAKGKTVAMICSGDAGVYGMAGLMYEVGQDYPQVQVKVLPVSDKYMDYAREMESAMKKEGLRCETDARGEKIGCKIRTAQMERVPYMLIVGEKETGTGDVSVRKREEGDLGRMPLERFLGMLKEEGI